MRAVKLGFGIDAHRPALPGGKAWTRHFPAIALVCLATIALPAIGEETTTALNLALPTDNDAIFRGGGSEFYQYIDRDYQGVKSKPWEGGRYGFVRNPVATPAGFVYSRFHEGIDIRP